MALTFQVRRGLQAALAGASMVEGELAFTTDENLVYISDGTNKHLIGKVLSDTFANRPTAGISGRMFYATDTGDTYLDDGSSWQAVGISNLADMSGDLDDIADGTTYGKVANTEIDASGRVTQVNDGTNTVTAAQARTHIDSTLNPHGTTASQVGIDDTDDVLEGTSNLYYTEGRVSANTDVAANTTHRGNTANPHSTSIANVGSGTIANLNTALSDATLGAGLNDAGTSTTDLWSANKIENRVQQAEAGTDFKQEVKAATTANITLSNEQTIDGVALVAGDRVLVKNQTDATENGIYTVVDSGAWTRTSDADTSEELTGAVTTAIAGTANSGTAFLQNAVDPIIGTDNVTWVIFNGAGAINAGAGLQKDGNTISVLMGAGLAELPTGQVGVEVAADGGLTAGTLAGDTLSIVTDTTSANVVGVSTTSNGAGVKVDGTTIEDAGSETIGIADGGVTAAKLNAAVAGNGITGGGGSALAVNPDSTGGANLAKVVNVSSNGVAIKIDNVTIIENASGQLEVGSIDGGSL